MTEKQPSAGRTRVRISLSSHSGGEPALRQQLDGELFRKGNSIYLRYQEPPEVGMGRTSTTLRIEPSQLRVIRQGDVQFEQTFRTDARHLGYMQTAQGRIEIETITHAVEIQTGNDRESPLFAGWTYELSVMGEAAGRFRIELTAVPYHTT